MFNVVTIVREYGSGGADIGRELAELLGWECVDKQIIERVATMGKVDTSLAEEAEDRGREIERNSRCGHHYDAECQRRGYRPQAGKGTAGMLLRDEATAARIRQSIENVHQARLHSTRPPNGPTISFPTFNPASLGGRPKMWCQTRGAHPEHQHDHTTGTANLRCITWAGRSRRRYSDEYSAVGIKSQSGHRKHGRGYRGDEAQLFLPGILQAPRLLQSVSFDPG